MGRGIGGLTGMGYEVSQKGHNMSTFIALAVGSLAVSFIYHYIVSFKR